MAYLIINVGATQREGSGLVYKTVTGSTNAFDAAQRFDTKAQALRDCAAQPWQQVVDVVSVCGATLRANVPEGVGCATYASLARARSARVNVWHGQGRILPLFNKHHPRFRRSVYGPYRLLPDAWAIVFDTNNNTTNN